MTEHADELRLFGLDEAARVLGTDWRNVRRWVDSGEMPALFVGETLEPKVNLTMLRAWLVQRAMTEPAPKTIKRRRVA